jgi:hypothetical protein
MWKTKKVFDSRMDYPDFLLAFAHMRVDRRSFRVPTAHPYLLASITAMAGLDVLPSWAP